MELAVYNIQGKETGKKARLNDEIFAIEPNDHAIYLDVKQHLANARQGTHKSKQRNEVHGSTRKLHKQKGTGGSRKGSIKNPLFRGGGRIFGPQPRDYSFKLNKKLKKLARKSALTYKAKEGSITILENFNLDAPKTKEFASILKNFGVESTKALFVIPENNKNIYISSRNIPTANVIVASELNTYEVMDADKLFILEDSLSTIDNILSA
ncbi:MAG: 50S ribosomal protein L4 [Flavobacteriales bacterium]|nr:50S ribosomal protein L4 [Flavobacteriales bacterium]